MALVGGGLRKCRMAGLCSSVWEEAVPQLSLWCQTLWFLPIYHWCPSHCCPSAGAQTVSLCKSMCHVRPFKRRDLRILQFLLPPNSHWFLQRGVMGTYLPGTGALGWVVWCGAGPLTPKTPLFYIHHMWVWDQLVPSFCVSTLLFFLHIWNSLVVDIHTARFSNGSKWWSFYILVVILLWLYEEVSCL